VWSIILASDMTEKKDNWTMYEDELAEAYGISRTKMTKMRLDFHGNFREGLHWTRNRSRPRKIKWNREGAIALAKEVGVDSVVGELIIEKVEERTAAPAPDPNIERLRVVKRCRNPRLLFAVRFDDETKERISVWVKTNQVYKVPGVVFAKPDPDLPHGYWHEVRSKVRFQRTNVGG